MVTENRKKDTMNDGRATNEAYLVPVLGVFIGYLPRVRAL
jgi:hypothetical protein